MHRVAAVGWPNSLEPLHFRSARSPWRGHGNGSWLLGHIAACWKSWDDWLGIRFYFQITWNGYFTLLTYCIVQYFKFICSVIDLICIAIRSLNPLYRYRIQSLMMMISLGSYVLLTHISVLRSFQWWLFRIALVDVRRLIKEPYYGQFIE